jgi:hypothetical protein
MKDFEESIMTDPNTRPAPEQAPPPQQEIHGDGAADRYSNADDDIEAADTEKAGVKQPDAMGAGE